MKKFCIFCGKLPTDKNKEHVLPRWLLALTGDPKRIVRLGFNMQPGEQPTNREYAFDQFTFPACEKCNSAHSKMEILAKSVIEKILASTPILPTEISILLNWFDKVRVGLWLGFQQLSKNLHDIEPQFHIEHRIGQFDRLLVVERYSPAMQRLNFGGVDSPAFAFTPSAFSLTVNDFHFTNVSYSYLLSRRLGFPYPSESNLVRDQEGLLHNIQPARSRIMHPILQRTIREHGVIFYQPMFPMNIRNESSDYYGNPYIRQHCLDFENGIGAVFVEMPRIKARVLNSEELVLVDPPMVYGADELLIRSVINIGNWQDWLTDGTFGFGDLTPEQRTYVRSKQSLAKGVNKILRNHHEQLLSKRGYIK